MKKLHSSIAEGVGFELAGDGGGGCGRLDVAKEEPGVPRRCYILTIT